MKKLKRILAMVLSFVIIFTMMSFEPIVTVKASELAETFANGADVGWLPQMEATGFKFYDDDKTEQDCLQILKDHGIDSIRLRMWVNPDMTSKTDGHCSTEEVVAMAKRANDMGFRIMIDLHYSDSWADPGKQVIPAAWANDTIDELVAHVSSYTTEVMQALQNEGVTPEWVQIGNEINPGMLLPLGSMSNPSNLVRLINAGSDAVKAIFSDTKIVIHRANGYETAHFQGFFDTLTNTDGGIRYDVIGVSYYPGSDYFSTINDLGENLNNLASRYGKEVMVVEVGGDISVDEDAPTYVYNLLVSVRQKLLEVPAGKGTGMFYWEPQGARIWSGYALSAWNNDGTPSIAMDAFLPAATYANPKPVTAFDLEQDSATVEIDKYIKLNPIFTPSKPTFSGITYSSSDTSVATVTVTGIVSGIKVGTATITATSYDGGFTATCDVEVVASSSLIHNADFESGLDYWTVSGTSDAVNIENTGYSGVKKLHYYSSEAADFTVSQTITGLENGSYNLSAVVAGCAEEITAEIFATNGQGLKKSTSYRTISWDQWNKITVSNISVVDGTLTVGFDMKYTGGQWGDIDNFILSKNETTVLQDLRADGTTITGFDPAVTSYDVPLADGTTKVPVVTATAFDESASLVISQAEELPGKTTVTVTIGSDVKTYTIYFFVYQNYIVNGDLEAGNADGFTIPDWTAYSLSDTVHSGSKAMGYWNDVAFQFEAYQSFSELEDGIYSFSAWSEGARGNYTDHIYAISKSDVKRTANVTNTEWNEWHQAVIPDIVVTGGALKVGVYVDAPAGNWGAYDDFELIKVRGPKQITGIGTVDKVLQLGETTTAQASTAEPKAGGWASSDTTVASIDADTGIVTALSAGTSTISYHNSESGLTNSKSITVYPEAKIVNPTIGIVQVGNGNVIPTGFTNPESGQIIIWTSDDTSKAIIDSVTGEIMPLAQGDTIVSYQVIEMSTGRVVVKGSLDVVVTTEEPTTTPTITPTETPTTEPTITPTVVPTTTPIVDVIAGVGNQLPVSVAVAVVNKSVEAIVSIDVDDVLERADKNTSKEPLDVQIPIVSEALLRQVKNPLISEVQVTVLADQNVFHNEKLNVGIELEKELIRAAADKEKDITVLVKDEAGKELYSWRFKGTELAQADHEINNVTLSLDVVDVKDLPALKDLLNKEEDNQLKGLTINFDHEGTLPAEAEVRVYVGSLASKIVNGKSIKTKVYLYHYNTTNNKLETLPNSTRYTIDQDGYITIRIVHCSTYVALTKKASNDVITSLLGQMKAEKVSYILDKKSKKNDMINLMLPETLNFDYLMNDNYTGDGVRPVSVSYRSSDRKLVTVNKRGCITAKASGKAYVYVDIKLYSGKTKTIRVSVTVK